MRAHAGDLELQAADDHARAAAVAHIARSWRGKVARSDFKVAMAALFCLRGAGGAGGLFSTRQRPTCIATARAPSFTILKSPSCACRRSRWSWQHMPLDWSSARPLRIAGTLPG